MEKILYADNHALSIILNAWLWICLDILFVICNIQFGEVHIPGEHNVKTDVLSKKTFTLGYVSGAPVTRF